jgi:hypothetical protein
VSLEAAVFGQYARYVRERHPDAPTPGFYRADQLFADASGCARAWATPRSSRA